MSPLVDPELLSRIATLEQRLGCSFDKPEIVLMALTHKSFVNENRGREFKDNERLEFLGDAVIDLAISHRLMDLCPDASEGKLSRLRASLVNEEGLAKVARALNLGELLRVGRGEELTLGREKSSLLADALEAVLGALFQQGGMDAVMPVVDRLFGAALEQARDGSLEHDYKTDLQEVAQALLRSGPRYRVVREEGPDHAKLFEVEVVIAGEGYGKGTGRSKKDAEQLAARQALERLRAGPARPAAPEGAASLDGQSPPASADPTRQS